MYRVGPCDEWSHWAVVLRAALTCIPRPYMPATGCQHAYGVLAIVQVRYARFCTVKRNEC